MNQKHFLAQLPRAAIAAAAILVLGACATAPQNNATLDDAKSAYQRASTDAQIVRSAPVELQKAQQALQRAEAALGAGENVDTVEHYAILARQRTEVAIQAGQVAQAEQAVAAAALQRDRIMIDSRTREADTQRALAEQAKLQAESQRGLADTARQQAETQRAEAEAARKLAEQRLAAAQTAQAQNAATQARAKSLEQQLADMQARQTDRGMVLTLGDVLFDTGKAQLKAGAGRTLDQLAAFMKENTERSVAVEGYTDSVGGESLNQALSERRALAVKSALLDRGVDSGRVSTQGLGMSNPVATNATAAGRQQNRRVEIVIANKAG